MTPICHKIILKLQTEIYYDTRVEGVDNTQCRFYEYPTTAWKIFK